MSTTADMPTFRLAPDQDPQKIDRLLRQYIAKIAPPTMQKRIRALISTKPALIDRNQSALTAAVQTYRHGLGAFSIFLRCGGIIPVMKLIQEILGIPVVLMSFGLLDDRVHAPNEKFHLPNFLEALKPPYSFG